jgi:hypothetical protein
VKIANPGLVKADIASRAELSDLEEEEKYALGRSRLRKRRSLYTPEDEKEDTYAHLARAGRRAALTRQYEKEHPGDPRVAAKERRAAKARRAKLKQGARGAVNFAKRAVLVAVGAILSGVLTAVGTLNKMFSVITSIGDDVRRQTLQGEKYNFSSEFTVGWERFAEQSKIDKDLLYNAAGTMQANFGGPLQLNNRAIEQLARIYRMW